VSLNTVTHMQYFIATVATITSQYNLKVFHPKEYTTLTVQLSKTRARVKLLDNEHGNLKLLLSAFLG